MMKINKARLIISAFLTILGSLLLFTTTDREFINLQPTEGASHAIVLDSSKTYQQTFTATRPSISQLGLFLSPPTINTPSDNISIIVSSRNKKLAEEIIPTEFINKGSATQVTFSPPIYISTGDTITFAIQVPPSLDKKIRIQERVPDPSFSTANVAFYINDVKQNSPLGYQVDFVYRPALAIQLGGFIILLAIFNIFPSLQLYIIGVSFLFSLPLILLNNFSWPIFIFTSIALAGMVLLLNRHKLTLLPVIFGAQAFAFSTWLPLHATADRSIYAILALLPLLFVIIPKNIISKNRRKKIIIAAALTVLLLSIFSSINIPVKISPLTANPRDIFLDPIQPPSSIKVIGASWDHFGSFLGITVLSLAFIGIIWQGPKHKAILITGIIGALLALVPPITSLFTAILPVPPQHLIILTTFSLAYFSAWGLFGLQQYLRPQKTSTHMTDILSISLIGIITFIALFDLFNVAATTLEFGLLQ